MIIFGSLLTIYEVGRMCEAAGPIVIIGSSLKNPAPYLRDMVWAVTIFEVTRWLARGLLDHSELQLNRRCTVLILDIKQ